MYAMFYFLGSAFRGSSLSPCGTKPWPSFSLLNVFQLKDIWIFLINCLDPNCIVVEMSGTPLCLCLCFLLSSVLSNANSAAESKMADDNNIVEQYRATTSPTPATIPEGTVETAFIVMSVLFALCCTSCFCWYRWNRKRRYAMWADEDVEEYVQL